MTIKIVGVAKKIKLKKITCKNCNSILEYSPEDEKAETFQNYDPNVYIDCPSCNNHVYISW